MKQTLKELENKYGRHGRVVLIMAFTQMVEMGADNARKLTDDDLERCEGNGLMTKGFVQDIFRLAHILADYNVVDVIKYLGADDCEEKYNRMLTIAYNAICLGQLDEQYEHDELLDELGITEEEFEEIME